MPSLPPTPAPRAGDVPVPRSSRDDHLDFTIPRAKVDRPGTVYESKYPRYRSNTLLMQKTKLCLTLSQSFPLPSLLSFPPPLRSRGACAHCTACISDDKTSTTYSHANARWVLRSGAQRFARPAVCSSIAWHPTHPNHPARANCLAQKYNNNRTIGFPKHIIRRRRSVTWLATVRRTARRTSAHETLCTVHMLARCFLALSACLPSAVNVRACLLFFIIFYFIFLLLFSSFFSPSCYAVLLEIEGESDSGDEAIPFPSVTKLITDSAGTF